MRVSVCVGVELICQFVRACTCIVCAFGVD